MNIAMNNSYTEKLNKWIVNPCKHNIKPKYNLYFPTWGNILNQQLIINSLNNDYLFLISKPYYHIII